MHYVDLIVEKRDHVATITFNRPERLNAFRRHTYPRDVGGPWPTSTPTRMSHSVILAANGRGFCTGHDMGEAPQPPELRLSRHARPGASTPTSARRCFQLRQPLVAAINGWCAAGGFGFALCCDILIAGEEARFYNPQIKFGYPSPSRASGPCSTSTPPRPSPKTSSSAAATSTRRMPCAWASSAGSSPTTASSMRPGLSPRRWPRTPPRTSWRCSGR